VPVINVPAGGPYGGIGSDYGGFDAPQSYAHSVAGSIGSGDTQMPGATGSLRYAASDISQSYVTSATASAGPYDARHVTSSGEAADEDKEFLGCIFPKRDPGRYEKVYNACTQRPGWAEWKHFR
jgi:hypothetical protein